MASLSQNRNNLASPRKLRAREASSVGFIDAGESGNSELTASDMVLAQIVIDFEALARLAERAIESDTSEQSHAEALGRLRQLALRGADMARDAVAPEG